MRLFLLLAAVNLCAQETVIRTTVPLILVPVSVTDRHGKIINGLPDSDFEVRDNDNVVKHSLETTIQPIALVVAIQTSATAGPSLAKIQKIGSLFDPLVVGERGVAAIVTYSDQVKVVQGFTGSADDLNAKDAVARTGRRLPDRGTVE